MIKDPVLIKEVRDFCIEVSEKYDPLTQSEVDDLYGGGVPPVGNELYAKLDDSLTVYIKSKDSGNVTIGGAVYQTKDGETESLCDYLINYMTEHEDTLTSEQIGDPSFSVCTLKWDSNFGVNNGVNFDDWKLSDEVRDFAQDITGMYDPVLNEDPEYTDERITAYLQDGTKVALFSKDSKYVEVNNNLYLTEGGMVKKLWEYLNDYITEHENTE